MAKKIRRSSGEEVKQARKRFFEEGLARLDVDGGELHGNCCLIPSVFGAISKVHFEWRFCRNQTLEVGLHFEKTDAKLAKARLEAVVPFRARISEHLKMETICEPSRPGGKGKSARLAVEKRSQWIDEALMVWAVHAMRAFREILNPVICDLKESEKR